MSQANKRPVQGHLRGERLEARVTSDEKCSLTKRAAACRAARISCWPAWRAPPAKRSRSINGLSCRFVTAKPLCRRQ